jgi:hypothetical protein
MSPAVAETLPAPALPVEEKMVGGIVTKPAPAKAEKQAAPDAFSKPSKLEAQKGYVRPFRDAVVHVRRDGAGRKILCPVTILPKDHSDFHARQPGVIDRVKCTTCRAEYAASEFVWNGSDEVVGT